MLLEIGLGIAAYALGEKSNKDEAYQNRDKLISLGKWCFSENGELTFEECPCKMCAKEREEEEIDFSDIPDDEEGL